MNLQFRPVTVNNQRIVAFGDVDHTATNHIRDIDWIKQILDNYDKDHFEDQLVRFFGTAEVEGFEDRVSNFRRLRDTLYKADFKLIAVFDTALTRFVNEIGNS